MKEYDLSTSEEIARVAGRKSDYELIREFVMWDSRENEAALQVIVLEVYRRRGRLTFLIFSLLAFLTNFIVMPAALIAMSDRLFYFEDTPKDIKRINLVGFVVVGLGPLFFLE
ncbi:hypothetical protein [Paraflavitalea sp. CAU 1676]|uniref:hypothetical protein n=1 Tax=Paraflavitalea sp. CAU 1676 TaxID=3032598 RepID=UPI0023DB0B9D|nr:hypothetical protein [Paraflavitalea sp. CAU 1676]MDF2187719.1 hypothetical protein [Paraflavitalea sp. CAU 1676]